MTRTLLDLAERTLATFAQAFLAAVTLGGVTDLHAVELAAVAGGYAVGKYLLVLANGYLATPAANPSPAATGRKGS